MSDYIQSFSMYIDRGWTNIDNSLQIVKLAARQILLVGYPQIDIHSSFY